MCLYSNRKRLKVAQEDIICYKWVCKLTYGKYCTPFQYVRVTDKIINGEEPFVAIGNIGTKHFDFFGEEEYQFSCGLIHTYSDLEKAKKEYGKNWTKNDEEGEYNCIFKCVIKKGTSYIEGHDGCGVPCYGSKEIVFLEQVI